MKLSKLIYEIKNGVRNISSDNLNGRIKEHKKYESDMRVYKYADSAAALPAAVALGAGVVEAVWGILQMSGILPSGHGVFRVTGSFFNPGPYGCLLGTVFPFSYGCLRISGRKWLRNIGMVSMLIIIPPLAGSLSRTGWIAATAGCVVVEICENRNYILCKIKEEYSRNRCRTTGGVVCLVILVVLILAGLYLIKAPSARGRLLIWKVAIRVIGANPLSGVGSEYGLGAYGDAQEEYFLTGCDSGDEDMLAGAPEYFFNEFISTAVAYGIPAAALMIGVMVFAIVNAARSGHYGICGSVTAMMFACSGSYPMTFGVYASVASALTVSALLAAPIKGRNLKWIRVTAMAVTVLWTINVFHNIRNRQIAKERYDKVHWMYQSGLHGRFV